MDSAFAIDYASWLSTVAHEPLETIVRSFGEKIPHVCIDCYHRMCSGPTNVMEIPLKGFTYLYDYCSELNACAREDRAVLAYGISQSSTERRDASRIRGFPGSDARGDRGHMVAHAAGGGLDLNVFHQDAYLNRGWSPDGKRYRAMERYCSENDGTFFFSRLVYADATARPAEIEFGILTSDRTLWVEAFRNIRAE